MFKDTGGIDAASILLNLTDYRVIAATHESSGRQVLVEPIATEAACPSCGVLTTRIEARPVHRVKDLPAGGHDLQFPGSAKAAHGLPREGSRTAVLRANHRAAALPGQDHREALPATGRRDALRAARGLPGRCRALRLMANRHGPAEHRRRAGRERGPHVHPPPGHRRAPFPARSATRAAGPGKVVRIRAVVDRVHGPGYHGKILDIVDGRRGAAVKRWRRPGQGNGAKSEGRSY